MSLPSARKVFITGASSGIGHALAEHYAAQGVVLGLVARRGELLNAQADTLKQLGATEVACYALDVTRREAVLAAAEDFIAR